MPQALSGCQGLGWAAGQGAGWTGGLRHRGGRARRGRRQSRQPGGPGLPFPWEGSHCVLPNGKQAGKLGQPGAGTWATGLNENLGPWTLGSVQGIHGAAVHRKQFF